MLSHAYYVGVVTRKQCLPCCHVMGRAGLSIIGLELISQTTGHHQPQSAQKLQHTDTKCLGAPWSWGGLPATRAPMGSCQWRAAPAPGPPALSVGAAPTTGACSWRLRLRLATNPLQFWGHNTLFIFLYFTEIWIITFTVQGCHLVLWWHCQPSRFSGYNVVQWRQSNWYHAASVNSGS